MRGKPPLELDKPALCGRRFDPSPAARAAESRGETLDQVLDRNVAELLQELRVAFTGVQILPSDRLPPGQKAALVVAADRLLVAASYSTGDGAVHDFEAVFEEELSQDFTGPPSDMVLVGT